MAGYTTRGFVNGFKAHCANLDLAPTVAEIVEALADFREYGTDAFVAADRLADRHAA